MSNVITLEQAASQLAAELPKGAKAHARKPAPANLKADSAGGFLPAGTQLLEYRIERVLGHGGFGVTYLAQDSHLDKVVAIKEYLPAELTCRNGTRVTVRCAEEREAFDWGLQQFIKEARTLARFAHPNLVPVHRFFQANDTAYFVMEYVEGETFASLLRREPPTEERLRAVLLPVMAGLEAVHRAGILHRDVKPENILLRPDGAPMLIDFGAARINLGTMTRSAIATLTAGYAPLEQYGACGRQGPWTDIYALGAVAYRAITGHKPIESVCRVHDDPLVPAFVSGLGRFSPTLLHAVDWALAVNAEDRPRTIGEWQRALDGRGAVPRRVTTVSSRKAVDPGPALPRPQIVSTTATTVIRPRPWSPLGFALCTALALSLIALPFAMQDGTAQPIKVAAVVPSPTASPVTAAVKAPAKAQPRVPVQVAHAAAPAPKRAEPAITTVAQREPLSSFRDCPDCPQMVVLPSGAFQMGSPPGAPEARAWEGPVHRVTLRAPLAMGRFEVTTAQWRACVRGGGCPPQPAGATANAKLPVVNVSHADALSYAAWLSRTTGRRYRLPSEAEWEYAARAGTTTSRFWGADAARQCAYANAADRAARANAGAGAKLAACSDGHAALAPAGSLKPNWFDLHDMAGNAWEWTADCWRDSYAGAPADGRAVDSPQCAARVMRGGSWRTGSEHLRSAARSSGAHGQRGNNVGFRVVAD